MFRQCHNSIQPDPTNTGARWTNWIERFETYLIAADITDDKRKRALLLYQAGPEVHEIFKTLTDTGEEYETAKEALTKHFEPAKNPIFEIYNFRQAKQRADESIDEFNTRLRTLATHCKFSDTDFEIKMQIVCNGTSNRGKKSGSQFCSSFRNRRNFPRFTGQRNTARKDMLQVWLLVSTLQTTMSG